MTLYHDNIQVLYLTTYLQICHQILRNIPFLGYLWESDIITLHYKDISLHAVRRLYPKSGHLRD